MFVLNLCWKINLVYPYCNCTKLNVTFGYQTQSCSLEKFRNYDNLNFETPNVIFLLNRCYGYCNAVDITQKPLGINFGFAYL